MAESPGLKVVLCWAATAEHVATLSGLLHTPCTIVAAHSPEALVDLSRDANVLVAGFGANATEAAWRSASQLKLIHSLNVGVDNIEALADVPVPVANVSRAHSVSVAEHAIAMLLAWCKNVVPSDVAFKEDHWLRPEHTVRLEDKMAAIIGLGNIGIEIARRLKAFGLRVTGTKRHGTSLDLNGTGVDQIYAYTELGTILPEADFVFVACPLTPETEGLIGPTEFQAMKPKSVLVNIARAPIVQEEALYTALTTGQIAGACLDVWYSSAPGGAMFEGAHPPARLPINRLPNVVASPHLGYKTEQAFDRIWAILADNIDRLAQGLPLTNVVNKRAGY